MLWGGTQDSTHQEFQLFPVLFVSRRPIAWGDQGPHGIEVAIFGRGGDPARERRFHVYKELRGVTIHRPGYTPGMGTEDEEEGMSGPGIWES